MTEFKRYEYQLNAVEALVEAHPEFLDIFTSEERQIFERYYLPNWDEVTDYRAYYDKLHTDNPRILDEIRPLMSKFILAHEIADGERLLP